MNTGIENKNIPALLSSTQQLRTHWSGLIVNIMNFAIIANIAVWTVFLQAYVGVFKDTNVWDHSYIAFASTISLILLFLWRLYTKALDSGITKLYADFVYFEGKLESPPEYGTTGYLKRQLGDAGDFIIDDKLTVEQKAKIVTRLVEKKLSGGRTHDIINWVTIILMLVFVLVIFSLGIFGFWHLGYGAQEQGIIRPDIKWICGIISIFSFTGMFWLMIIWPKKPKKKYIELIKAEIRKEETASQMCLGGDR